MHPLQVTLASRSLNDLATETLQQILQLLTNLDPLNSQNDDTLPYVPSLKPRKGFFTPVASLSLVSKRLREICRPFLFSYICCKSSTRLTKVIHAYRYDLNPKGLDAAREFVKTLSVKLLPRNVAKIRNERQRTAQRRHDTEVGLQAGLIPQIFSSLHCLRLHHVSNLDPFLNAWKSMHSLRFLDITFRVSAIAAHEEMPVDNRKTGVHSCTPPLEGLRVGVYFDGRLGRGQLFDCTKEKSLVQMLALIRTASPTLFEFAFVGRKSVSFDALKSLRFPRLRRLSLWSIACPASDVRVFVLAHQPHLAELNVHYSRDHPYPTLSCISRIMRGVCPRTDNYAASGVVEEEVDTLVHDDDRRGWGHHKCSAFAYAKRAGEVVELSLSFPRVHLSNDNLRARNLSHFLGQFKHLKALTLRVSEHKEHNLRGLMRSLAAICREQVQELCTLTIFFELEPSSGLDFTVTPDWDEIFLPGDETYRDSECLFGEDDEEFAELVNRCQTESEKLDHKWKRTEDKYYPEVKRIMTSFFAEAASMREVFWHFRMPKEGARSSCWLWRKLQPKGSKTGETGSSSAFLVHDLLIQGSGPQPPRFSSAVGREAVYFRTFEHENERY